jgi:hypothetical protein
MQKFNNGQALKISPNPKTTQKGTTNQSQGKTRTKKLTNKN